MCSEGARCAESASTICATALGSTSARLRSSGRRPICRVSPRGSRVVVRMIHACGLVDLGAGSCLRRPSSLPRGRALADWRADPVRHGDGGAWHYAVRDCPRATKWSARCAIRASRPCQELGTTRSAAALELWGDRLGGAVVAIGNAPTALFRSARNARRRGAQARGDPRHSRRLRRRRRSKGCAGREPARRPVPDRARAEWAEAPMTAAAVNALARSGICTWPENSSASASDRAIRS